jgi:hypothetical protein
VLFGVVVVCCLLLLLFVVCELVLFGVVLAELYCLLT